MTEKVQSYKKYNILSRREIEYYKVYFITGNKNDANIQNKTFPKSYNYYYTIIPSM